MKPHWRITPRFYGAPTLCARPGWSLGLGGLFFSSAYAWILIPSSACHRRQSPWRGPWRSFAGAPTSGSFWILACRLRWPLQASSGYFIISGAPADPRELASAASSSFFSLSTGFALTPHTHLRLTTVLLLPVARRSLRASPSAWGPHTFFF